MSLATAELPTDPVELRNFAQACQDALQAAELAVQFKTLEIEKLKFQIAKLRRMQFGRSSERINRQIEQLELRLEELETGVAEDTARTEQSKPPAASGERRKPKRQPLPDHLRRQEVVHQPANDGACTCPACGRGMAKLGEDVTEVLDYVPGHFQVVRHVRPKYACTACDAITQAPAPAMPTPRGRATPGMLAHVLVGKFCDHLPLYRQSEIYAREGVELDRSTLSEWLRAGAARQPTRSVGRREGKARLASRPGTGRLAARSGDRCDSPACVRRREDPWRRHTVPRAGARAGAHQNRAPVDLCAR